MKRVIRAILIALRLPIGFGLGWFLLDVIRLKSPVDLNFFIFCLFAALLLTSLWAEESMYIERQRAADEEFRKAYEEQMRKYLEDMDKD